MALGAAALSAQNIFDLDKTSPATLGNSLDLQFDGAPGSTLGLLMVSFTGGPTPISLFDPNDTRSVQVGTELSAVWPILVSSATGTGTFSMGLPGNAAFGDLVFHWQIAMLASSGPTIIGDLSNDVVAQTGTAQTGLFTQAMLSAPRAFSLGFFDRDNNAGAGDFVVAGGGAGTLTSATGLSSTEVWDFRRMTVSAGVNMNTARALHLAVRLDDDRVLIIGGADATGAVLASCELYDPTTNAYSQTGSMSTSRILHAACKLADGRVMVTGGTSTLVDLVSTISGTLRTVEIFNPATGTWSPGPAIGGHRLGPALTLLPNTLVMCSGGLQVTFIFGLPFAATSTTAVQFWNPSTNSWSAGPNMNHGRAGHQYNQVTLNSGRVLMTGGINVTSLTNAANAAPINGAEVYDPVANAWLAANMTTARGLHSANLLPDGRVAICGGAQGTLTVPVPIDGVELFDPSTNSWTTLPPLNGPRSGHAAGVTPDGTLLLFGGQGATTTLTSIETLRF